MPSNILEFDLRGWTEWFRQIQFAWIPDFHIRKQSKQDASQETLGAYPQQPRQWKMQICKCLSRIRRNRRDSERQSSEPIFNQKNRFQRSKRHKVLLQQCRNLKRGHSWTFEEQRSGSEQQSIFDSPRRGWDDLDDATQKWQRRQSWAFGIPRGHHRIKYLH